VASHDERVVGGKTLEQFEPAAFRTLARLRAEAFGARNPSAESREVPVNREVLASEPDGDGDR
jgi:hypothetical protein